MRVLLEILFIAFIFMIGYAIGGVDADEAIAKEVAKTEDYAKSFDRCMMILAVEGQRK